MGKPSSTGKKPQIPRTTGERVLGVIPARGGSRSIIRKNLKHLHGKPLLSYTITEALQAKRLQRVIVSTDDDEIISTSRKYGAEVPFVRPQYLASDNALAIDVVQHAIKTLESKGEEYDIIVMLQPTSPLRVAEDIDTCVDLLISTKATSVISVESVGANHPNRMKLIDSGGRLHDYAREVVENQPRQKLPEIYIRNGAIYATRKDVLMNERSFKGRDSRAYVMPPERSVNIDEEIDFILAEILMRNLDRGEARATNSIQAPWKSWYENGMMEVILPDDWTVSLAEMKGSKAVNDEEIKESILSPIGTPRLAEMVEGKRSICIAVDDLTKPTEASRIIPVLMEELRAGGVEEEGVYFLISTGTHRPLTREDLIKKLGKDIVENFRVYNHNAYQNNKFLGNTRAGTPIYIDAFFLNADFRIGICTLMPHPYAGFRGGGKIVMPGLAGIDSIDANHRPVNESLQGQIGKVQGNSRREDIDEAARIARLDFIVNTISTSRGKTAGVFAGHPSKAFVKATEAASRIYSTTVPYGLDVGVFNAFPRDNWFLLSLNALNVWGSRDDDKQVVRQGGTIVIINACSEGVGEHGLVGKGMRHHIRRDKHGTFKGLLEGRRLLFFTPTINQRVIDDHYPKGVLAFQKWEALVEELKKHHPAGTRACVFPCASLQLDEALVREARRELTPTEILSSRK